MPPTLYARTISTLLPRRPCTTSYSVVIPRYHQPHTPKRTRTDDTPAAKRAPIFEGFTEDLLNAPIHLLPPQTRTSTNAPPPSSPDTPQNEKEDRLQRARVVFGSRLLAPADRRREIEALSQNIAGVLVPPRPDEPDNCCMSGCVNCVWDKYGEEMEEWALKSREAKARVEELRVGGKATGVMSKDKGAPGHVAVSMDDDGGGSETNWVGGGDGGGGVTGKGEVPGGEEDLFKGVPVGIREFMRTEKRLKEKKKQRATAAAAG
ncbi:hypothetical protein B0A50_01277 [Salinomyces thailandicus]|uniref:Oxidoreductase-like domain-containing protein n=1 Tax=Salinomyces thailandicus TaxID=706561 RepID=A0A4U0U9L1_9PEZI|nr:hypothetical protein B0A50_01277 [Salinomyces thailandica]